MHRIVLVATGWSRLSLMNIISDCIRFEIQLIPPPATHTRIHKDFCVEIHRSYPEAVRENGRAMAIYPNGRDDGFSP